ncbi:MAG: ABC transporter six-transmembrane domain-containing protein [Chitinophagales bacterium]|nr:ABC transporter six-transmembrane domain-containing protein [Chitinophagales bacterium]
MTFQSIFKRFRFRISFTFLLVLLEAGLAILFPLFIGYAIDDALKGAYNGAFLLGGLGVASLIVGSSRRLFDSRFYARIYRELGFDISTREGLTPSKQTARLSMLGEMVEFFENSIPQIVNSIIGLVGTLIIVASLNSKIFAGCLVILLFVFLVYALTKNKTIRFNTEYNNAVERQVDILSKNDAPSLKNYLRNLMKWNVKLSDLETINFSIVWMLMMGFLVISIIWAVDGGTVNYGAVFALIMYVFQYIESVITLPFFYQQWLRLKEISKRLSEVVIFDLSQKKVV